MLQKGKEAAYDLGLVVLGNFILAFGVALFIVPNSILSGGVAGVAVAIKPLIPDVSTTLVINILTVCLFLVGSAALGKNFAFKTLLSTFLYPTFLSIMSILPEHFTITNDPILSALYGGVFVGIGVGLVFRTGASTGGMDIPPLIMSKYVHIPLGTLVMIVDGLTVMVGMMLNGIEPALIGLISVWISGYMVNKTMMFGLSSAKSLMIISEKHEAILSAIANEVDRGSTILQAKGGYKKDDRPVLMVVILKKQFPEVNRIIQHIDPGAFVIVHDVNEVQGEGFTFDEDSFH